MSSKVFEAALDAIEAVLGTTRTAILTFDDAHVLRFRSWRMLSDDYRSAVEGHAPWAADASAPQAVLVADAATDPAYFSLFQREGIGSLAFIPLVTRGRLLGEFMICYGEPHVFAPHELETSQAIANHLASVISRFSAIAKLEDTIRYNELFAGALAHDLRNPLGAIMTAAQLVLMQREGEPHDRGAKPLTRILTSGQRMTRMIDQLLDFTRARSGGGIEVSPREVNLADLCAQAIGEIELANPHWQILCEIAGDVGGDWDGDRLLQVISNLVANAGQHGTRDCPIHVRLDGTRADIVRLQVQNQGAVPQPLLVHLFDPFRSTRHRHDQSQGLGLGLFIVQEIVRSHGGTVEVESSDEAGTTLSICLPRGRQGGHDVAGR